MNNHKQEIQIICLYSINYYIFTIHYFQMYRKGGHLTLKHCTTKPIWHTISHGNQMSQKFGCLFITWYTLYCIFSRITSKSNSCIYACQKMFSTLRFLPKKLCGTKVDVNRLSIFFTHITTYPCTEVQTVWLEDML